MTNAAGKLEGIKVVDLSQFLPGPALTLMMADQGAEVTKVEPAGGDPARAMAPFETGENGTHSVWFTNLNRGKRSITLDLKSAAGKQAMWVLLEQADVMIEGFRPGVMKRLGFDYEAVSARNPRIVYCSISAFGQDGAMAHHPAHDMAVQAVAGSLSVNDGPNEIPVVPGVPSADMAAGLTGLSAVLMALIGREKSGRGDYIDCAMLDAMMPWCSHTAGTAIAGGESPRSASQRSLGGAAFYNVYSTLDARQIVLGGREEKFARNLLGALGMPERVEEAMREAGEQDQLIADLRKIFATKTRGEWVQWFAGRDVAFSPVLDYREALDSAHFAERGLWIETGGRHMIAPAIRFASQARRTVSGQVPDLS
ncbi:CoA transferase [Altererythrobacter aquiaggeris]|uniref:CaiB/BaiF CoA transferase family protein n=1 Tax=Aestuarierythrobacter aquiaggeris TaxID=1898396 RepID=UPI00301AD35E